MVPVMVVDQLLAMCTAVTLVLTLGATPLSPPIWVSMAVASATLNSGRARGLSAGAEPLPGLTITRLLPKLAI